MNIGRYQIVREIARSNDIVYEAFDPQLGRRIALKELALDVRISEPERRQRIDRFFREARAAGNLSHPGIVTIFDFGDDKGRYFIAMEYLEGETLKNHINRMGALPLPEALRIILALCDAVEYAHARSIVHRDIKPDNIHLLPDGGVKVTDFGIARLLGEPTITVAGQVFGTPSYMAPEQVRGASVDARTDIFSLGLVLFEMLSGRKAFWGETLETIIYRILSEPIQPLHEQPSYINSVITRAVAKNPTDRFPSAGQMKAALTSGGRLPDYLIYAAQNKTPVPLGATTTFTQNGSTYQGQTNQNGPMDRTVMAQNTGFSQPNLATGVHQNMTHPTPNKNINNIIAGVLGVFVIGIAVVIGTMALRTATVGARAGMAADSSDTTYNNASTRYANKDYAGALPLFQQVRLDPTTRSSTKLQAEDGIVFCYIGLAEDAKQKSDWAAAVRWYDEALLIQPRNAEVAALRAKVSEIANSLGSPTPPLPTENNRTQIFPAPRRQDTPATTADQFVAGTQEREKQANDLLAQGDAAFRSGNIDNATELWEQAREKGGGTSVFNEAQNRLLKGSP